MLGTIKTTPLETSMQAPVLRDLPEIGQSHSSTGASDPGPGSWTLCYSSSGPDLRHTPELDVPWLGIVLGMGLVA